MPAAAPVKAVGTHTAVTAAPARKQIADNAISTTLNVAIQGRAIRLAVPTRYRWIKINGIRAISTTGSSSTNNSSGILQGYARRTCASRPIYGRRSHRSDLSVWIGTGENGFIRGC